MKTRSSAIYFVYYLNNLLTLNVSVFKLSSRHINFFKSHRSYEG